MYITNISVQQEPIIFNIVEVILRTDDAGCCMPYPQHFKRFTRDIIFHYLIMFHDSNRINILAAYAQNVMQIYRKNIL